MLVTLDGIVIDVALLPAGYAIKVVAALLKRVPSMEVKFWLAGSTTIEVREMVPINTPSPMLVTLAGMVMDVGAVAPCSA
jgi:hypothetical protein